MGLDGSRGVRRSYRNPSQMHAPVGAPAGANTAANGRLRGSRRPVRACRRSYRGLRCACRAYPPIRKPVFFRIPAENSTSRLRQAPGNSLAISAAISSTRSSAASRLAA